MLRALVSLAVLTSLACSSGGAGSTNLGAGGGGGGGGDFTRLCTNLCAWQAKCDKPEANCNAQCTTATTRYQGKWTAAFVTSAASCFETLACGQNDDACVANFAAVDPAYPNIPEVQACLKRRTDCAPTSWSDDRCLSITALTAAARAEANACLTKACGEISTCLGNAGAFNY